MLCICVFVHFLGGESTALIIFWKTTHNTKWVRDLLLILEGERETQKLRVSVSYQTAQRVLTCMQFSVLCWGLKAEIENRQGLEAWLAKEDQTTTLCYRRILILIPAAHSWYQMQPLCYYKQQQKKPQQNGGLTQHFGDWFSGGSLNICSYFICHKGLVFL